MSVDVGGRLRGVKDWVHMKTAKMMQDFNWLCNLDVNHKLLLTFKIPARLASGFAFFQPAISPRRGIITFLSHDLRMTGSGAKV